jgi:hypothetical protein
MIHKFRLTFILLILNAIAFITLFLLSNGQYKDYQESKGLNYVISSFTQALEGLQIESTQLQESIKITRQDNNWFVEEPVQWPANNFSVNQIIHQLNLLRESAKFTYDELIETDQNLKDFGLDEPKLVFNLIRGSQSINLIVGNSTPLGNKLYLYLPEKEAIYVVETDLLNDAVLNIKDLYRKEIFDIPNFEIDALNYRFQTSEKDNRSQLSVRLEKNLNDSSWQFKSPLNVEADALLVSKTLQTLTATEVEKFLPLEMVDPNMLGFENPYMKLSLQGNKRRNTLILGNSLSDPNNNKSYYAKLADNPTVFTVKGSQYDQFIQAHKDLREKNFITLQTESISTIDISDLQNDTKLQKLENSEWQALSLNENTPTKPFQADSEVINNFIKDLDTLRAVDFFADNPTEEDLNALSFNQPLLQILVFSNEENILSINAVQHPDNETLLLAKTQNDPTIYTIDKASYLKKFSAEPLSYKNRTIEKFPEVARIQELQIQDIQNNTLLLDYPSDTLNATTTSKLLASLKEFKVARYIDTGTLKQSNGDSATSWNYKLSFKIALPGDFEDKLEERIYYFNERASGSSQLGSTAKQDLVFELSQNLIQSIHPFIHSFELTPESMNEEVADPTNVEKIPKINLPK